MPLTLDELVLNYRDYYGAYHHHKEQMAFSAATLYLGAATALVIQGPEVWKWAPACAISLLLLASSALGLSFVGWQLYYRSFAADLVAACTTVATTLLGPPPGSGPSLAAKQYRGLTLPAVLVETLESIKRDRKPLGGARVAAGITLVAMLAWSIAVLFAIRRAA